MYLLICFWTEFPRDSEQAITISDVTYVKGTTTDFASGRASFKFSSTSSSDLISVSGNLASLVDGVGNSIFLSNSTHYTFNNLFYPGTNTTCLDISGVYLPFADYQGDLTWGGVEHYYATFRGVQAAVLPEINWSKVYGFTETFKDNNAFTSVHCNAWHIDSACSTGIPNGTNSTAYCNDAQLVTTGQASKSSKSFFDAKNVAPYNNIS